MHRFLVVSVVPRSTSGISDRPQVHRLPSQSDAHGMVVFYEVAGGLMIIGDFTRQRLNGPAWRPLPTALSISQADLA